MEHILIQGNIVLSRWYAQVDYLFSAISPSPAECCAVCSSFPVPVPLLSLPSHTLSTPPLELSVFVLSLVGSGVLAFACSLSEFSFSGGSLGCLDELVFGLGVCFIAPVFFLLVFRALGLFSAGRDQIQIAYLSYKEVLKLTIFTVAN